MMIKTWTLLLFAILLFQGCTEPVSVSNNTDLTIVPYPSSTSFNNDSIHLKGRFKAINDLKLSHPAQILLDEAQFGVTEKEEVLVHYVTDTLLKNEAYKLSIRDNGITITGSDLQAQIWGTQTLLQLKKNNYLPIVEITDEPSHSYRSLMVDLSRNWHDIATLKQLISLCSYYKIKYVQMHLTDDALFTFPSTTFWALASKQSYTRDELYELNMYAHARGVVLVPEIDVPGHSSGFIRAMPEWFGLQDPKTNPYTLNMGSERVYNALDRLFTDVSDAFPFSPYIHIGGDEVFLEGFEQDTGVQAYMKEKKLETLDELYHHFILRTSEIVKSKNKTPIIWSDFTNKGSVKIPKDVIVMSWKLSEYLPGEMLEDGYRLINASWQPLYVVNNRKWSPEQVYNWSPTIWKGSQTPSDFEGYIVPENKQILGGSMSAWEQNQYKAYHSIKLRLSAMAERLWSAEKYDYEHFKWRNEAVSKKLDQQLFPFELQEQGRYFPTQTEPNFKEDMWFSDTLKLKVKPQDDQLVIRYELDGKMPTPASKIIPNSMVITKNTNIAFQAYFEGVETGKTILKSYQLVPVSLDVSGLANDLAPRSWEKHKFIDSITVRMDSDRPGTIRYTTDNSAPTQKSPIYEAPFSISHSGFIRAALFDSNGAQIGKERWEEYEQLQLEESLTTGKPVTTSNKFEAGISALITDGKITRWDHWGSHTNGNNWVIVDLETEQTIDTFKTYTFWDDDRYYRYTIEVSLDRKNWDLVVDRSKNIEKSVPTGTCDLIAPVQARYLKLNLIKNSANPGLHVSEFQAFDATTTHPNCK